MHKAYLFESHSKSVTRTHCFCCCCAFELCLDWWLAATTMAPRALGVHPGLARGLNVAMFHRGVAADYTSVHKK